MTFIDLWETNDDKAKNHLEKVPILWHEVKTMRDHVVRLQMVKVFEPRSWSFNPGFGLGVQFEAWTSF